MRPDGDMYFNMLQKSKDVVKRQKMVVACKQPRKIIKEGLANLIAEWDNPEGLKMIPMKNL